MKTYLSIQLAYCVVLFIGSVENSAEKILGYNFHKDTKGPYNFRFSTSDGYEREEIAELLHEGTEFESIFLRGSYQYQGADGKTYTVKYRADDNGFHPEGDHFEVPPFVPWPSKIDIRYNEDQLKNIEAEKPKQTTVSPTRIQTTQRPTKFEYRTIGTSTVSSRYYTTSKPPFMFMRLKKTKYTTESSMPDLVNTIKLLTTQRPPKFEYRPIGTSTVPSRYYTTSEPKHTVKNSKANYVSPIKFLTTQRPPKFQYTSIGSSTIPTRYLSTSKPTYYFNKNGRQSKSSKGFNPIDIPEKMIPKITQQYIPTSTLTPPNRGDVVASSTAKKPEFFSVPLITREYIPTSSSSPEVKGDIEGYTVDAENNRNILQQRRKMSKNTNFVGTMPTLSDIISERKFKNISNNEIHPRIIYEGRPLDNEYFSLEDSLSVSIPESKAFGSRTKTRKIVRDFVTTEYPAIRRTGKTKTS